MPVYDFIVSVRVPAGDQQEAGEMLENGLAAGLPLTDRRVMSVTELAENVRYVRADASAGADGTMA